MVDPRTLDRSQVSVPRRPVGLAVDNDTAYVLTDAKVSMIDSAAGVLAGQFDTGVGGDEFAIASGPAGVWAATDDSLFRVRRTGVFFGRR